jgi:hypothetical protein
LRAGPAKRLMDDMRHTALLTGGAVTAGLLLAGSQAANSATTATAVLASARAGHPVSTAVRFPGAAEGATTQLLVVGVPGSSGDEDSATAVNRAQNQVASQQAIGTSSLSVSFTPTRAGRYPVFVFAERNLGCGSATMSAAEGGPVTITQVGVVSVSR